MTNLRSLSDLFKAARKLAAVCAFAMAIAASASAQTNTFPASGNAGVGTTTPQTDIEIKNASHAAVTINSGNGSTDAALLFQRAGINKWFLQSRNSGTPSDSFALYDAVNFTFPFVVQRSGNVGIGTTAPNQALTVGGWNQSAYGSTAQFYSGNTTSQTNQLNVTDTKDTWGLILGSNGASVAQLGYHGPSWAHVINVESAPLSLGANNTAVLNLTSSGNPAAYCGTALLNNSNAWGGGVAYYPLLGSTGCVGGVQGLIMLSAPHIPYSSGSAGAFTRMADSVAATNYWDVGLLGDQYAIRRNAGSAFVTVTNGGSVGIGTNAPIGPLSIGNSAVTHSDGYIVLGKRDGLGGSRQFRVGFDSSFNFVIGDYGNNNAAGSWISPFAINWQAPSNSLYINSAGKIGMGIPAPNYKLDVNGEVNATGFLINGTPISAGGGSQWTPSGASIYYNAGRVGIGGAGANVYATDAWVENNIHVQGPETLAQGGRGRLRVGSAWGYSGLFADPSSTGGGNDLVLGASSATVRVGPGSAAIQNFSVPNGNVGIGIAPTTYKLDVNGNTNVTGNLNVTGTVNAKYQDLAEWVPSSEQLSAGTVVVLDTSKSNQVIASGTAYDTRVAGVISTQPGITLGESGEGKVLVATTGRVRVKVDASRGAIQIGDLLVTSDVAGVAMKSEPVEFAGRKMHMPGTIIGKALEPLAKGSGEILVLLSLQ